MARVIAVVSGKGGVGKSTLCAALAVKLCKTGYKVLAIDMDFGLRNLDVMLGLENNCIYDMQDVFQKNCSAHKAVVKHNVYKNLGFIAAAGVVDRQTISISRMKEIIDDLKDAYDYIILDCPAGLHNGFVLSACVCDTALIVTTPDTYAVREAQAARDALKKYRVSDMHLIINRVRPVLVNKKVVMNVDQIIDSVAVKLIGLICEDENAIIATNCGKELDYINTNAGVCIADICKRIEGQSIPQFKFWS